MEAYDFLHEWVKPIIKGDYQDFSSKKVEGYSLFVSEYKKPHVQAMVKADVLELLHNIVLCCAFLDIFCKKAVIHISYGIVFLLFSLFKMWL